MNGNANAAIAVIVSILINFSLLPINSYLQKGLAPGQSRAFEQALRRDWLVA